MTYIEGGMHIDQAVCRLIDAANRTGAEIREKFNDVELVARPGDRPADVSRPFFEDVRRSERRRAAVDKLTTGALVALIAYRTVPRTKSLNDLHTDLCEAADALIEALR